MCRGPFSLLCRLTDEPRVAGRARNPAGGLAQNRTFKESYLMFPFASLRAAVSASQGGRLHFFPKVSNFLLLLCVCVCVKADCRRVCVPVCLAWPHCLAPGPPRRQFLVVAAKHLLLRFQICSKSLFFYSCAYKCVRACVFFPLFFLTCGPSDLASDKRRSLMLRPLPLLSLALSAKIWCLRPVR